MADLHNFQMIDNYIYMYHTKTYIILPAYADSVQDRTDVSFSSETPMLRSAPIYSYSKSGPRTVQINFQLHRELMKELNYSNSKLAQRVNVNDDYVDILIKDLQACALPSYQEALKMVDPPLVALRLGDDIFIKGIVQGGVGITYKYPLLRDGRYACVDFNLTISEVDPYDANTARSQGSFRGMSSYLI